MKYSEFDAQQINEDIRYINRFLKPYERFEEVVGSNDSSIELPDPSQIPLDYFVELVNEYNKELDRLLNQLYGHKKKIEKLENDIEQLNHLCEKLKSESKKIHDNMQNQTEIIWNMFSRYSNNKFQKLKNLWLYYTVNKKEVPIDNNYYPKFRKYRSLKT